MLDAEQHELDEAGKQDLQGVKAEESDKNKDEYSNIHGKVEESDKNGASHSQVYRKIGECYCCCIFVLC